MGEGANGEWGNEVTMTNAPPPPVWPDRRPVIVTDVSRPGGFWIRFVAYLIDALIVSIAAVIVAGILIAFLVGSGESFDDESTSPAVVIAVIVMIVAMIVANWLYEALLTSSARGATLGKQALGLRIIRADGAQLSFGRATARYFLKVMITPLVPLLIGYLMAAFTNRKRALHDVLADTLVIRSP